MKVFISWSGAESRQIAEALRDWLPAIFESVEPYMSARDNEAGVRWGTVISDNLEETDFGILCLTPENLQAPWILFEAGALSKAVQVARVVPLLHRLTPASVTSPLSQFHMKQLDEAGIRDVVSLINSALPTTRSESALTLAFQGLWPSLRDRLAQVQVSEDSHTPYRSDRELIEEILSTVRNTYQSLPIPAGTAVEAARRLARSHRLATLREMSEVSSYELNGDLLTVETETEEDGFSFMEKASGADRTLADELHREQLTVTVWVKPANGSRNRLGVFLVGPRRESVPE